MNSLIKQSESKISDDWVEEMLQIQSALASLTADNFFEISNYVLLFPRLSENYYFAARCFIFAVDRFPYSAHLLTQILQIIAKNISDKDFFIKFVLEFIKPRAESDPMSFLPQRCYFLRFCGDNAVFSSDIITVAIYLFTQTCPNSTIDIAFYHIWFQDVIFQNDWTFSQQVLNSFEAALYSHQISSSYIQFYSESLLSRAKSYEHYCEIIHRQNDIIESLKEDQYPNVSDPNYIYESQPLDTTSFFNYKPTILMLAAYFGSSSVFSKLLSNGANIDATDSIGRPVAAYAAAGGNFDILRQCPHYMDQGPVAIQFFHPFFSFLDMNDACYLAAVRHNNIRAFKFFKSRGFDFSPYFREAVLFESYEIIFLILKSGYSGPVFLLEACMNSCSKIVELLIRHPRSSVDGCLWASVKNNDLRTLRLLLKDPRVDPNETDEFGDTILHYAVLHQYLEIVLELLECERLDVNKRNQEGWAPVHVATRNIDLLGSHREAIAIYANPDSRFPPRVFIRYRSKLACIQLVSALAKCPRIDFSQEINDKQKPLHILARSGKLELIKTVIKEETHENDYNAVDSFGRTPFILSSINGRSSAFMSFVVLAHCDPNIQDINGMTGLHYLMKYHHSESIRFVIDSMDPEFINAKDKFGRTALMYGCIRGSFECIRSIACLLSVDFETCDKRGLTLEQVADLTKSKFVKFLIQSAVAKRAEIIARSENN